MLRRSFLKSLIATIVASQIPFDSYVYVPNEVEQWIKVSGEFLIVNPRAFAYIENIGE